MSKAAVAACPEHVFCEQAVSRAALHAFCVRTYASFQDRRHLYMLCDYLPGGDLMDVLVADARVVRPRPRGLFDSAMRLAAGCVGGNAAAATRGGSNGSSSSSGAGPRLLKGLSERVAAFYAGCVVLALEHLHGRGVVYRIDARVGKGAQPRPAAATVAPVRLRGLDPSSTYALEAFAGPIRLAPTDSSVHDFTAGAEFPMVHDVGPATEAGVPESASGGALMDEGLTLTAGGSAIWVAYRRVR